MSLLRQNEPSLISRIAEKILSRLTFNPAGLRVDGSGATISTTISSGTVTTVTTVANANNVSLGRNSPDGQGIQMSYISYQQGFRKNLVIS